MAFIIGSAMYSDIWRKSSIRFENVGNRVSDILISKNISERAEKI